MSVGTRRPRVTIVNTLMMLFLDVNETQRCVKQHLHFVNRWPFLITERADGVTQRLQLRLRFAAGPRGPMRLDERNDARDASQGERIWDEVSSSMRRTRAAAAGGFSARATVYITPSSGLGGTEDETARQGRRRKLQHVGQTIDDRVGRADNDLDDVAFMSRGLRAADRSPTIDGQLTNL